jgi:branched-chain amino acid transport system ATP-binding protein
MPLLTLEGLRAGHGGGADVLHGLSITVEQGELVCLIGANGAGKTTLLRSIMGLVKPRAGRIQFAGQEIAGMATASIARLGASLVPEGRGVFAGLTVLDNLRLAATPWGGHGAALQLEFDRVFALFPILAERRSQLAWSLSGGQQQMLAIGRALVARPKLLLLDEPSLGLAPNLVEQVFDTLAEINRQGVSTLLVEQNALMALDVSDRGYVLELGRIVAADTAAALRADARVQGAYLGG